MYPLLARTISSPRSTRCDILSLSSWLLFKNVQDEDAVHRTILDRFPTRFSTNIILFIVDKLWLMNLSTYFIPWIVVSAEPINVGNNDCCFAFFWIVKYNVMNLCGYLVICTANFLYYLNQLWYLSFGHRSHTRPVVCPNWFALDHRLLSLVWGILWFGRYTTIHNHGILFLARLFYTLIFIRALKHKRWWHQ